MLEGRLRPNCVYSLCAEREGGAGDAGGQVEALADLAPQLLVDDLHQPTLADHEPEELVQVERLLGHDGDAVDWGAYNKVASNHR